MSTKRNLDYSPSSRRPHKSTLARRNVCELVEGSAGSRSESTNLRTPPSFTKVLTSKYQIHTSIRRLCRLNLPKAFCDEHNVASNVTMMDSTGHTLWHMSCQNAAVAKGYYIITNGWREFSYDHSLRLNAKLVFTLVSPSHFVVEFATRVMRPTQDGKDYPWERKHRSAPTNYSEKVQGEAMATTTGMLPEASKQRPEGQMLRQTGAVKIGNRKSNWKDSMKKPNLLELTHLECKNPQGTSYLQILESDSEITDEDEEIAPEYNQP